METIPIIIWSIFVLAAAVMIMGFGLMFYNELKHNKKKN